MELRDLAAHLSHVSLERCDIGLERLHVCAQRFHLGQYGLDRFLQPIELRIDLVLEDGLDDSAHSVGVESALVFRQVRFISHGHHATRYVQCA